MTDAMTAEPAARDPLLSASVVYDESSDGGAIAAARAFTADFLAAAPSVRGAPVADERVELAQLVVSELVTNAVRHAGGHCRLLLELRRDTLEISVYDRAAAAPVPRGHDPGRIGQHGVEIVVAICESVSVEPEAEGKRVRACLSLLPQYADAAPAGGHRGPLRTPPRGTPPRTGATLHHAIATPTQNTRNNMTGTTEPLRVEDHVRGSD
ncbi:ATP-binding protein [Streptomyces venezuelae]|uniref:ATP-binding protein n=1 Tax=Streptomyces venezuelae TaxID=54571 RepID=UPI00123D61A3|nr:ATP-binding protein [Streptomyces venezuelae]QES16818.1 ATP-binding protein [Streptomyces venezuelae]